MWQHRELSWILFLRDLKAQYRQSYLGYAWIFVPILATTLTWMYLNSTKIIQVQTTEIPYPLFVLTGSLIWNAFSASVNQPLLSFTSGKEVFMKLNVPVESFLLSGLGHVVFNLILQTLSVIPVCWFLGQPFAATVWLFPFAIVCVVLIGTCVGMILLPFGSLYNDFGRFTTVALGFAMLLSPVVYPPPTEGTASVVMQWNPLTPVIETTRDCLFTGRFDDASAMLLVTAVCAIVLGIALVAMRVAMPRLVERMGM